MFINTGVYFSNITTNNIACNPYCYAYMKKKINATQTEAIYTFLGKKIQTKPKARYTTRSIKYRNKSKAKLKKLKSYHSWSSGEGIRPAVPFLEFSSLPCHQLWSSLLMIWIISPTRNLMPASLQGMRSSFAGSYSNCALTYIYKKEFIKDTAILLLVLYYE